MSTLQTKIFLNKLKEGREKEEGMKWRNVDSFARDVTRILCHSCTTLLLSGKEVKTDFSKSFAESANRNMEGK